MLLEGDDGMRGAGRHCSHLLTTDLITNFAHIETSHLLAWLQDSSFEFPVKPPPTSHEIESKRLQSAKCRSAAKVSAVPPPVTLFFSRAASDDIVH